MNETPITITRTLTHASGDAEIDAIRFIAELVSILDTEARWRVLDYATKRIRSDTYGSENVAKGVPRANP